MWRFARRAMGTRFEIALVEPDGLRAESLAEAALDEVERIEAQLSVYRYTSEICGLNHLAHAGPVQLEPSLFNLLDCCRMISVATDGAFDPCVGPMIRAWGFVEGRGALPDPERLCQAAESSGFRHVVLDGASRTIRFDHSGCEVNLGAVGKGHAVDRAMVVLEDDGAGDYLIHGGTSTVGARGSDPGNSAGAGWRVSLRAPTAEDPDPGCVILSDSCLSVSAPHGRSFEVGGRRYGHVIDPRTGQPQTSGRLAAVVHPSAMLTDALSTALLVLGIEGTAMLEREFPGCEWLYLDSDGTLNRSAGWPSTSVRGPETETSSGERA